MPWLETSPMTEQRAFDRFRQEYNEDRPHEALGDRTPASVYRPLPRPFPDRLPAIEYPGHFQVRFVSNAGTFRFRNRLLFIANALNQHAIGLEEIDDGIWSIYFGQVLLARLDERDFEVRGDRRLRGSCLRWTRPRERLHAAPS